MTMKDILNYIDNHLEEPLTAEYLANMTGYSASHFLRLFKAETGMPCMSYIWKKRLLASANNIAAGGRIIDAALRYGWGSHSAYSKAFRREFGFSPSLLRAARMSIDYLGGNSMNTMIQGTVTTGMTKEQLFQMLKLSVKKNGIALPESLLDEMYRYSCEVYSGMKRYSGEEYVTHPLNVAILLSEMEADPDVILAGMFCDAGKKGNMEPVAKEKLPGNVQKLIDSLEFCLNTALSSVPDNIALIKLAERLHNMQTIAFINEDKKKLRARETLQYFVPLAEKYHYYDLARELKKLAEPSAGQ